jgi:hypothetical protein
MRNEIKILGSILDHYENIKILNLKKIYQSRIINSIYFDTSDLKYFTMSEEGITPRKKVRFRWYNSNFKKGKLEIKNKNTFYSNKKIIEVNVKDKFLLSKIIFRALKEKLIPTLLVSYKRKYYAYKNNSRLTLDTDIKYSALNRETKILNLYRPEISILEIKKNINDNSVIYQSIFGARIARYSKYCEGIKSTTNNLVAGLGFEPRTFRL